jgi:hypothetical protein
MGPDPVTALAPPEDSTATRVYRLPVLEPPVVGSFYDVVPLRDDLWALLCMQRGRQEKVAWFTDRQATIGAMKSAQATADMLAKHHG